MGTILIAECIECPKSVLCPLDIIPLSIRYSLSASINIKQCFEHDHMNMITAQEKSCHTDDEA